MTAVWVGTSGYNYPEWKGSFYPEDLPAAKMLPYYAARFPTVEINYTFYRLPSLKAVAGWAAATPSPYRLTLKTPRRITHEQRLANCAELVRRFCETASTLGEKLGVLLVQLPPFARKDVGVLAAFLADVPDGVRMAFEFRHASWLDDEVFEALAARNMALCVADGGGTDVPVRVTADYAYFRLRDDAYTRADIERWGEIIAAETAACRDVFVYFKHEEQGKGPALARVLIDSLGLDRTGGIPRRSG